MLAACLQLAPTSAMTSSSTSEVLAEADGHIFEAIAAAQPIQRIAKLLDRMSADDQANLLSELDEAHRLQLLEEMASDEDLAELLDHEEDTAGRIMSPDFFALSASFSSSGCATSFSSFRSVSASA